MIALAKLALGSPWVIAALMIAASGIFGFYKGWITEHDAKIAAVAAKDAEWRQAIGAANAAAEADIQARVQAALAASAAVTPAPADRSGIERLCREDAACRDRQPKK